MNAIEILEKLESDNSRLFKEALLREHKGNETLRRALVMAADPWKNWGVIKYDKLPSGAGGHDDATLTSFMARLGGPVRRGARRVPHHEGRQR